MIVLRLRITDILKQNLRQMKESLINGIPNHNLYYRDGTIIQGEESPSWKEQVEAAKDIKEIDEYKEFMNEVLSGKTPDEAVEAVRVKKNAAEAAAEKFQEIIQIQDQEEMAYWDGVHKQEESEMEWAYYSSVCLLIRDENKYLKEWLDWYMKNGFDHIYIYDNGVNETVTDVITDDISEKITVIPWHGEFQNVQEDAYNHFLENYGAETRWVTFLDSDEFINFSEGVSVNDYLQQNELYTNIVISFVEYNANGQETYEDAPVRERFTEEVDAYGCQIYFKNFVQPHRIDSMFRHYPRFSMLGNYVKNPPKEEVVIEHYYTKSWEEWQQKISRGSSDPVMVKSLNEFFIYNPDMSYLKGENVKQEYNN